MAKKVKTVLKLNIPAGEANPAPPIGPALGQHGLNIMEFCKAYNEKTADKKGTVIPAVITVYEDRTFSFVTKTPPTASLLTKALGIQKGSGRPNKEKVGKISLDKAQEIAQEKMEDLNAKDIEAAIQTVKGTARSMGIEIEG